jgi:hypothetical protein
MLECLSQAGLSSLVKCLLVRPGPYLEMKILKGALLQQAPALSANIKLIQKGLPGIIALTHYENS